MLRRAGHTAAREHTFMLRVLEVYSPVADQDWVCHIWHGFCMCLARWRGDREGGSFVSVAVARLGRGGWF